MKEERSLLLLSATVAVACLAVLVLVIGIVVLLDPIP